MTEQTPLTKNNQRFASLRLTLPISIVRQWELKEGDRLDWSWKVIDGKMVLVVDKTDNRSSSRYNNNNDMDRRTNSLPEQQQPKQLRQQHDKQKQKTYNQLMKLAGRAAYRATKKR